MDIHVSIDSYVLAGDAYSHSLVSLNDCGYRDIPPDILDTTQMKTRLLIRPIYMGM